MFNILGSLMKSIAKMSAKTGSVACTVWFMDEPEMPTTMIEK